MFTKLKKKIAKAIGEFVIRHEGLEREIEPTVLIKMNDIEGLVPTLQAIEKRISDHYRKHLGVVKIIEAYKNEPGPRT